MSKVKLVLTFDSALVSQGTLIDQMQRFISLHALHTAESVVIIDDADSEREFVRKDRRGSTGWRAQSKEEG